MRQALFARTDNLRDMAERIRAREGAGTDVLQASLAAAGLAVGDGATGVDLERLWSALDAAQRGSGRAGGSDREIERHLRRSFADLAARDRAAHGRLSHLLNGRFVTGDGGGTRDEVRELLRWREILVSLLPEGHRPDRRGLWSPAA
jgi:hypothetical protein